jgi:hypothetical protein
MSHPSSRTSSSLQDHNTYTFFFPLEYPTNTHLKDFTSSLLVLTLVLCTKHTHPNFFGGTLNEVVPVNISIDVLKFTTLNDILLIRYVTVCAASPHRYLGTLMAKRRHLVTSRMCMFFLSATPLCSGVLTYVV